MSNRRLERKKEREDVWGILLTRKKSHENGNEKKKVCKHGTHFYMRSKAARLTSASIIQNKKPFKI